MTYDFSISPKDFDVSLLPPNARTVGSDEFGEAVHAYLTKEFEGFGGTARIIVSDKLIQVTWTPDPDNPDPIQPALEKLSRGQLPQAIQLLELLRSRSPNDLGHSLQPRDGTAKDWENRRRRRGFAACCDDQSF